MKFPNWALIGLVWALFILLGVCVDVIRAEPAEPSPLCAPLLDLRRSQVDFWVTFSANHPGDEFAAQMALESVQALERLRRSGRK